MMKSGELVKEWQLLFTQLRHIRVLSRSNTIAGTPELNPRNTAWSMFKSDGRRLQNAHFRPDRRRKLNAVGRGGASPEFC